MEHVILFSVLSNSQLFDYAYCPTSSVTVQLALHAYFGPVIYTKKGDFLFLYFLLILQYVHFLQRKYSLNSFNLLGHTAEPRQVPSC
jgi:hypothetical protein